MTPAATPSTAKNTPPTTPSTCLRKVTANRMPGNTIIKPEPAIELRWCVFLATTDNKTTSARRGFDFYPTKLKTMLMDLRPTARASASTTQTVVMRKCAQRPNSRFLLKSVRSVRRPTNVLSGKPIASVTHMPKRPTVANLRKGKMRNKAKAKARNKDTYTSVAG